MSGMKRYQDPALYEALAAEYVLGTLRGPAMRRFEALMRERPYIQLAVSQWEQKVNGLGETVPQVSPPAKVWRAIKRDVSQIERRRFVSTVPFWKRAGLWQFATAALALGLVAVTLPLSKPDAMPMPAYMAVLEDDSAAPMFVTFADQRSRTISVRFMASPSPLSDNDLELWAMPKSGGAPVSVGVVHRDREDTMIPLTQAHWKQINDAGMFAISMEPKGGSPTGQPTGPVMYKGQCLNFI